MKFKIVYLALALVLVFSMAAALGTGIAQANGTTPAVMSGGQHTVELEEDGIAVDNAGDNLLQFTSHGHVLGFSNDGVIVGSRDHMLRIDFVNSRTVDPEAGEDSPIETGKGMAAPLSRVTYHNIWDDVTVVYEASEGAIVKSTYYVNATEDGVPVEHIRLGYNRPVSLDENGNLVIAYETGTIVETAPVAWQEVKGERKPVIAAYTLYGDQEVGFSLGDYMPGIPVVIDPELTWNTFLGGSGYDNGYGIAVDASGNVYVAGSSGATWGSPVRAFTSVTSDSDAFVAKLDSSGSLTWHTFLGGSGYDRVYGIAVDASGNVYVAGSSGATWGSPVRAHTGANDAFAARLTSSGSLTWHTFLGGSGNDNGYGIAVDGSGNVYVSGDSNAIWGSPERAYTSGDDAFAARLTSSGSLIWNTFLGGSGGDRGWGIAVDGSGNVYVAGWSTATWGSPVRAYTSGNDAFAAKLTSSGSLTWNTFLGGSGTDYGRGIAVDGSGNVYVSGDSNATWGSPVRAYTSDSDAFVAKLTSSGSLTWNTFLGGSGYDRGWRIAMDGSGNVYVAGYSDATWASPVRAYTSAYDAFAAKLTSSGSLTWNTFLGGSGYDSGWGIAVDGSGNVYVSGDSNAIWGSPERAYTSGYDAFVVKIFDPEVVIFPDPNLEAAIRDAIGIPTGDIYQSDLVGLTVLIANLESISDLTGLEHCTSLTKLHLGQNQISDISSLSGLTNLTELRLLYNQINDISPLSDLTNLTRLWLSDNQISELSPLSNLTSLTYLTLGDNQIIDISALSGLTSLTGLSLGENQINDISPLSGLTNLTGLNLDYNQISDISPLLGLSSLTVLSLYDNQISNLSPLSGLTSLENLDLRGNQISDISPLSALTSLTELYLSSNQISDISPLSGLTSLTELLLRNNQISNLSPLSSLTSLTWLHLDYNQISDLSPLAGLTNLFYLDLQYNQISDLSGLSSLTSLDTLHLDDNQISDLAPLSGLTSLTSLSLRTNQISVISHLSGLTSLTHLELRINQISDLSPLATLTNLFLLHLTSNQISDIEPLVDNPGLSQGDNIQLGDNPLSVTSNCDYIPQLEARSVAVVYDSPSPPCSAIPLIVNTVGDGSVSKIPDQITYAYGASVGLNAIPELGWSFIGWSGNLTGNTNPEIITIDDEKTVTATFTQDQYTLTVNIVGDGSVTKNPYQVTYTYGTPVQLTATADPGWTFYEWIGDLISTNNPDTIVMDDDKTVYAIFNLINNTPVGIDITVALPCTTVTFGNVTVAGNTSCTTQQGNPGGGIPEGFRVKGQFVDITTTASYDQPGVEVCIPYDPSTPNPQKLKLFHSEGGHWVDVTTNVDTTNHLVCGYVTSLSWFFIGGEWVWIDDATGVPVFPTWYIGVVAALGAGVLAYLLRRRVLGRKTT